jgi:predicted enzyme related to lactoylglutathione lyase
MKTAALCLLALAACHTPPPAPAQDPEPQATMTPVPEPNPEMNLGAFSVSLSVKDIHASRAFYETLGFTYKAGDIEQNWIVLQNGVSTIGLFQGLFEGNIMTFNPGWDQRAQELDEFTDIRELQRRMKAGGLSLVMEADESTTGPASVMLTDPDGNMLLLDQHVQ